MKKTTKAIWIFLAIIAVTASGMLVLIQSRYFADVLKRVASRYMPTDFGVSGNFSELSVKLIPPGVVIKNPSIVLKEKNPAGLPAGTKLDAEYIDVTFQFFQLLTGAVTINAFALHGATLKLDLDESFFAAREQQQPRLATRFSWESLVRFNFRSVSLVDSQVDIRLSRKEGMLPVHVQSFAKELTVGRVVVNNQPGYDFAIDLQKGLIEFGSFRHSVSQLQASFSVSAAEVMIPNFGVQDGELNLHANGSIRGNVLKPKSLKADLNFIVRGPLPAWLDPGLAGRLVKLPKNTPVDGSITIDGRMLGDLMDVEKSLEVRAAVAVDNARFAEWRAEKLIAKGAWKPSLIVIDSAEAEIGEGRVRLGRAQFDAKSNGQPIKLNVALENADFRRLAGPALNEIYQLHMLITGDAEAEVTLGDDFGIDGSIDFAIEKFSFDNQKPFEKRPLNVLLSVPGFSLKSHFKIGSERVSLDRTELVLPHSRLKAFGKVDSSDGFDIDVRGPVSLADIGKLGAFDITGDGQLHWTIKGKKPWVELGFDAELENASYLNLKLGHVNGRLVYNDGNDLLTFHSVTSNLGRSQFIANGTIDIGKTDDLSMTIQVPRGTIQDFATMFDSFLKTAVPWYPYELSGQLNGVIKASGKTPLDKLSVEGDMELSNVEYHHEFFHYGKVHAGYRRGAYIAENAFIKKKNGVLRGNLFFGADDVLKFDLHSDGLSTLDIDRLANLGVPYRAPIRLETQGVGKLGKMKSSFKLAFGEGVVKTHSVPRSEVSFTTENGRLHGELSALGGRARGQLDLGFEKGSASSLDIESDHFDFKPFLIGINTALSDDPGLGTDITGSAHLKFQTGALSKLSGTFSLSSYALQRRGYSLALVKPVAFEISQGNYQFNGAKFMGRGSALEINGRAQDGKVDYDIGGAVDLGIVEFFSSEIAAVRGAAQVKANVFGAADSPHFKATVKAGGVDVRLRSIEQPFEDARFNVDWTDGLMKVSGIESKFAGGAVSGQGAVQLYAYKVPDLDFRAELDNPKVKVYPVAYARTSGRLTLIGSELPYKVVGSLNVAEALIKESFNLAEGSRILRSSKFLPQKSGGTAGEVQIFDLDVHMTADRGVLVKNDLFDCEVKGNIKIINSVQTPRILGQASVIHGRLLFKDNFFVIHSGNVFFKNPALIDPEFDLSAQTDIKGYKVMLVANGTASTPNLNFQSQPPLSQNDIVNLLTLGVTSSEYQNIARENRGAYSRDELYGLLFSQSGVNKGLQQKLGVKVRVDQSQVLLPENAFRARSNEDMVETVAPKVVVQKEVTKNLNASLGSTVGLGENQERNVNLEYDISRHWSVLGTYEDQRGSQPSQSRTSLGADVKYKLRFK